MRQKLHGQMALWAVLWAAAGPAGADGWRCLIADPPVSPDLPAVMDYGQQRKGQVPGVQCVCTQSYPAHCYCNGHGYRQGRCPDEARRK